MVYFNHYQVLSRQIVRSTTSPSGLGLFDPRLYFGMIFAKASTRCCSTDGPTGPVGASATVGAVALGPSSTVKSTNKSLHPASAVRCS